MDIFDELPVRMEYDKRDPLQILVMLFRDGHEHYTRVSISGAEKVMLERIIGEVTHGT